ATSNRRWETRNRDEMRIFLLGTGARPGVEEEAERLRPFLRQYCEIVVDDLEHRADLSGKSADLTLVLGGDGAILRAARQLGYSQAPVQGVNVGRLAHLADVSPDEPRARSPQMVKGEHHTTGHLMFEC